MRTASNANPISLDELRRLAAGRFGDLVKAVIDLERRIMLVDDPATRERIAELVSEMLIR